MSSGSLNANLYREFIEKCCRGKASVECFQSYRARRPEEAEQLVVHLAKALRVAAGALRDYEAVICKHVRNLALSYELTSACARQSECRDVARTLALFTVLYHDAGKCEVGYQLYAHRVRDDFALLHNYSSVAFVLSEETGIHDWFIARMEELQVPSGLAERLLAAAATAVMLHHEYYDYKKISAVDVLTPSTLAVAKNIPSGAEIFFDLNLASEVHKRALERAFEHVNYKQLRSLLRDPPQPKKEELVLEVESALELASSLHYEMGAVLWSLERPYESGEKRVIVSTSSLAEVLTYFVSIVDNLAAKERERHESQETRWYANLIQRYYGVYLAECEEP